MSDEKKKSNVDAELEALRQNSFVRSQRSQLNNAKVPEITMEKWRQEQKSVREGDQIKKKHAANYLHGYREQNIPTAATAKNKNSSQQKEIAPSASSRPPTKSTKEAIATAVIPTKLGTHDASANSEGHKTNTNRRIPESVLKKQATQAKIADMAKADAYAYKKKKEANKKLYMEHAAKYDAEYKDAEKADIEGRRTAKANGGFYVPAEPKLALVIRIRGTIGVSPKAKKIMQLFRLRQIHNAVFVRLNEATVRMLRLIEPYVTYGYPTRATIEKLIYKRGFAKLNKSRIPISENAVIEDGLGAKTGIVCCADLVHEISTVGANFKVANNFLWPFKLSSPNGGFSQKTKLVHFMEGGEAGARGEEINRLVKRMM
eukprot:CAMPEP_0172415420 /NCGR_PEP_ID=MMETSP1064-20121228/1805_1 /TAXON_ID=202472 /ORGANISM="Aulacoseira subarctica , Strain CCAP 1002/5" /LENGTH=373 /DNA_ID=CAMNT_0013152367 /DNA_START=60 /DNA_END=1181 /DNA_ORIENTATION=+